jgi:hypothetical protein
MEVKQTESKSFTVYAADLGYFEITARKYKDDALNIRESYQGTCTPSFHLLSSVALELFPKLLIAFEVCKKYRDNTEASEDDIRANILTEIKRFNHDLSALYNSIPDLMNHLGIEKVTEFRNGFVWEHRFTFKDGKNLQIKDVEAVRYGSFAKNRDVMTLCVFDNRIVELLNKVEAYVQTKSLTMRDALLGSANLG